MCTIMHYNIYTDLLHSTAVQNNTATTSVSAERQQNHQKVNSLNKVTALNDTNETVLSSSPLLSGIAVDKNKKVKRKPKIFSKFQRLSRTKIKKNSWI